MINEKKISMYAEKISSLDGMIFYSAFHFIWSNSITLIFDIFDEVQDSFSPENFRRGGVCA